MPKIARFIPPSAPVLKAAPPSGGGWLHEVKFDGWRAQLHKSGDQVVIFTRNGHDYTRRSPTIRDNMLSLPARSAIIDAEIVVCDGDVEGGAGHLCAWCFDLFEFDGRGDTRRLLSARRHCAIFQSPPTMTSAG